MKQNCIVKPDQAKKANAVHYHHLCFELLKILKFGFRSPLFGLRTLNCNALLQLQALGAIHSIPYLCARSCQMMLKFRWSRNDLVFLLAVAIKISSLFADYNFECIGNYGAMCSIWIHELYLIFNGMTDCCSLIFAMTLVSVFLSPFLLQCYIIHLS